MSLKTQKDLSSLIHEKIISTVAFVTSFHAICHFSGMYSGYLVVNANKVMKSTN